MEHGEKYGMLTLIKKIERPLDRKRKGTYWLCQCDCGNTCVRHTSDLKNGDSKSCGCLHKRKPIYDKAGIEISNHAGIYGFQNIYNGKWYVGKAKNLYNRYKDHYNDWAIHQEKQFYQAIKKYGWDGFNYYILKEYLEIPPEVELSQAEEFFIHEKNSYKDGYNASEHSSGGFVSLQHKEKCTQILEELNNNQKNENHPRTDFTKEEILQIFSYGMQGAPVKWVYEKYSSNHHITYESFKNLYRGQHFKDYLPLDWENRPVVATNAKLWGSWVVDIKTQYAQGISIEEIYKQYSDKATLLDIKRICYNKTYKQIQPRID